VTGGNWRDGSGRAPDRVPRTIAGQAAISALRASANEPPATELTTDTVPAEELRTWERPPAAASPSGSQPIGDRSDSRWWWTAVIVLLAVETWLRRRQRAVQHEAEVPHARVA